jgi:hypothetical protein
MGKNILSTRRSSKTMAEQRMHCFQLEDSENRQESGRRDPQLGNRALGES